ncbi:MAG: CoA transferase [Subtercola sp.]|nr:CoA transferase [Subtercola sp.]
MSGAGTSGTGTSGAAAQSFLDEIQSSFGVPRGTAVFTGDVSMLSNYAMTDLGSAAFAAVGLAVAELAQTEPTVTVDRTLATGWFHRASKALNPGAPRPGFNGMSRDFPTADGRFVRFQANYPHLRAAALAALGTSDDPAAITAVTARLTGEEIEDLVVTAGGAVGASRTREEWLAHPQGIAVSAEPVALIDVLGESADRGWRPTPGRPLAGIRVLDITRVLAGPISTRTLAAYGAEVLHLDPAGYDEPMGIGNGDLMLGKRNARLQLETAEGRERFLELLAGADILVHGLRADALERLDLGEQVRADVRPGLVEVTLNAYGWSGPWVNRRGFDTVVQASNGMAMAGAAWAGQDAPYRWPLSILDHATGYLMAAAAVRGLTRRRAEGVGSRTRFSLARTAELLCDYGAGPDEAVLELPIDGPWDPRIASGPNGPAHRLMPPLVVPGAEFSFDRPGDPFRTSTPVWIGV